MDNPSTIGAGDRTQVPTSGSLGQSPGYRYVDFGPCVPSFGLPLRTVATLSLLFFFATTEALSPTTVDVEHRLGDIVDAVSHLHPI